MSAPYAGDRGMAGWPIVSAARNSVGKVQRFVASRWSRQGRRRHPGGVRQRVVLSVGHRPATRAGQRAGSIVAVHEYWLSGLSAWVGITCSILCLSALIPYCTGVLLFAILNVVANGTLQNILPYCGFIGTLFIMMPHALFVFMDTISHL